MSVLPLSLRRSIPLVIILLVAATANAQQRVGVNAAVNADATGTPPNGAARRLVIGENVVFNERIQTAAAGQTQVLFIDQSTMTVGPNSDVTIDQFVFNPAAGTGTMALTASKGVLRLIGGALTKQEAPLSVRTTIATIALRGGVIVADVHEGNSLDVIFLFGKELRVTGTNGVSQTITQPGFAISVPGAGASPSTPFRAPPGVLAGMLSRLDGRTRGNGGATRVPTDTTVASSGIGDTISGNLAVSVQQAAAQTQAAQPQLTTTTVAANSQTSGGNTAPEVINCASSAAATGCNPQSTTVVGTTTSGQPVGGAPATPVTTPTGPVVVTYAGLAKANGGSLGFTDQSPNNRSPYTNGVIQNGNFTATLSNGTTVSFPLLPGTNTVQGSFVDPSGGPGTFTATTFFSSDQTFFYGSGTGTSGSLSGRPFIFGGQPVNQSFYQPTATNQFYAFNLQPDAALQTAIPYLPAQFGGNTPNAQVSPLLLATPANSQFGGFNPNTNPNGTAARWLQSSIAFNGAGASQSSAFTVNTGSFFTSSDTGTVAGTGPVRGSFLANGTSRPVRIGSSSATVPDGNGNNLFGGNTITGFVLDQNNYDTNLNFQQQLASAVPYGQPATNYAFNNPVVSAGTLPVGTRTSQVTTGFFGGVMYPLTPGSGFGSPYVLQGATGVATNAPGNQVFAVFSGSDPFTPSQSGINNITLTFGNPSGRSFARDAFIDDTRYAALESVTSASSINGNDLPTTPGGTFTPRLGMVTSGVVNNALPNGVTPCACQYLQWGYWTGELDTPDPTQTAATPHRPRPHQHLAGRHTDCRIGHQHAAGQARSSATIPDMSSARWSTTVPAMLRPAVSTAAIISEPIPAQSPSTISTAVRLPARSPVRAASMLAISRRPALQARSKANSSDRWRPKPAGHSVSERRPEPPTSPPVSSPASASPARGRASLVRGAHRGDHRLRHLARGRAAAEVAGVQRRVGGHALDRPHQRARPLPARRGARASSRRSRRCRSDWRGPCP